MQEILEAIPTCDVGSSWPLLVCLSTLSGCSPTPICIPFYTPYLENIQQSGDMATFPAIFFQFWTSSSCTLIPTVVSPLTNVKVVIDLATQRYPLSSFFKRVFPKKQGSLKT